MGSRRDRIKFLFFRIIRTLKVRALSIKRIFAKPKLPDGERRLIHLGCGEINSPGFINIDARPLPHVHFVGNVEDLSFLGDNYADLIYACCLLEHISHQKILNVLWEWRRVLKKGGVLRLSVPDFDKILSVYDDNLKKLSVIIPPLMGGQDYEHNFHHSIYNKDYLIELLKKAGFIVVREWSPEKVENHDFEDWASKKFIVNGKEYAISLNLEAVK